MPFDRSALPETLAYLEGEGLTPSPRGEWRTAACPFHGGTDSLRVHVARGAWVCMSCGEKGGDVLAFHMKRHGLGFVEAAKALGAWAEGGKPSKYRQAPMPFTARDGLTALKDEALLAAVAACNVAHGVALTDEDRARLLQAARRINFIVENAH